MVENGTLPETQSGEVGMPEIVCVECGHGHELIYRGWVWGNTRNPRHPQVCTELPSSYRT